ncbi:MAG: MFS transporter [Desulfitobacterium sp.]
MVLRIADRAKSKKGEVVFASLSMLIFAQIFPYALRQERILLWIFGVGGFLLLAIVIMVARNRAKDINEEDTNSDQTEVIDFKESEETQFVTDPAVVLIEAQHQIDLEAVDLDSTAEIIVDDLFDATNYEESTEPAEETETTELEEPVEPVESVELAESIERVEAVESEQPAEQTEVIDFKEYSEPIEPMAPTSPLITSFRQAEEFSIEDLIDRGFRAKEQGRFHLAAEWFILALEQKPSYDITFYLIVEICEHWGNGSSIHDALDKVTPYLNEYIQNAPPEWGIKLVEWLEVENLPIPREILGRTD